MKQPPFKPLIISACCGALAAFSAAPTVAQSVLAYPMSGQSAEQIRKDELDCERWAMERTGFNPRVGPPQAHAATPNVASSQGSGFGSGNTGQGGVVRDGARGAAIGAIGGAIAGDAGKGAAWGALGGAVFGGARRNRRQRQEADWERQQQMQMQQQQQQIMMQYEEGRRSFNGAVGLCMESRDYKVQY